MSPKLKTIQTLNKYKLAVCLMLAVSLFFILTPLNLGATSASSNTIKMSPVRSDINISPGDSKQIQITATNLTNEAILVKPSLNDFISGDERGTPALILDDNQYAPTRSLKRFVGELDNVLIPGRESKTISVNISVPENARPGGYFGAVRLSAVNPDGGGQVNLSASVASLILLTVNGETTESLRLTDFYVKKNGEIRDVFHNTEGAHISVRFENDGDVQLGPFGKVVVMRSGVVVHEVDFNNKDSRDMILPDSARVWDIPMENIDEIGDYTVQAFFTYGQKNQTTEVTKSFWVVPYIWIIVAAATLIALVVLIVVAVMYRRSRKRKYRKMGRGSRY